MPARIRYCLAAVIVALSALGATAYADRAAADTSIVSDRPVADLDLSILGSGDSDRRVIETAYQQVQHSFYEPVNPQRMLDGETKALNCLITDCVKHPKTVGKGPLPAGHATDSTRANLALIEGAVDNVTRQYPKAGTKAHVTDVALAGMLDGLGDPYTTYLNAAAIRALDEELKGGNFGGIGVYIGKDPKTGAFLVDPIEGNPAIKAGMRTGDTIVGINDQMLTPSMPLDDVERRIRGPRGTIVALRVKHPHGTQTATIRVMRDVVHVPSVRAKIEDGFSYVRLSDFGQTSADEVRDAFVAAKNKGVKGYILDLRNNGGGLLDAAVDISSLVIHQGPIVSTVDRAGRREVRAANGQAIDPLPLVILVNKYTASASEITAGALQDDHLATLIGTKTFGKGVVQSLYPLPDRGALKITTARYLTPNGRDIQHKGIVPDVVLDQRVDLPIIDTPADKQLAAAKAILRQKDQQ